MSEAANDQRRERNRTRPILIVVVILLLLLLVMLGVFFLRVLGPAGGGLFGLGGGEELVWVRSMYGFGPSQAEQLRDPSSVAVAPDGDIYATDPTRQRIMVFNPDGSFDHLLHTGAGGTVEGMFIRPESIDVDDAGNVYIADSFATKIIVFDEADAFVREWPLDEMARGVRVVGDRVYALDVGKIIVFDTQGNRLGEFGQRGPGPGDIDAYQGVEADDEGIYLADALNGRLQAFDIQGELLWAQPPLKGEPISGASGDGEPEGADAGSEGDQSTDEGAAADEGIQPEVETPSPYQLPQDLTFDAAGRLIVIDAFDFSLFVVDPETGFVLNEFGEFGQDDGKFFYPTSIDYDADRDWFAVADTRNNRVQIVRLPGSGGDAMSALRRALSSPYRYCCIPLLLLLLAVIILTLSSRRSRLRMRRDALQEEALE